MQTFRDLESHLGAVPGPVVRLLGSIDLANGRAIARRAQYADALDKLVRVARIQSTEASNAIEDITAPRARVEALVDEKTTPENRSEEEIAGYRDVLNTIHASHADIPFTNNVLLQFHRDLYGYTADRNAGRWKIADNEVIEKRPDGSEVVRFKAVSVSETPRAMDELQDRFERARAADEHHPLLLLASYVFDFLMVHPVQDGNGRMSRLITLLLLYQADYEVGRYISLEKLIDDSRETYYEALKKSTDGWHEGEHDIWPWTRYFLGVLIAAHKTFDERLDLVGRRGAKSEAVRRFIRNSLSETFTFEDIRQSTPAVSDAQIRKVMGELKAMTPPAIERVSAGRYAKWRRRHTNF